MPERIRQIVGDVLGLPWSSVGPDTGAATIAAWDSVAHINIVLAIEAEYGVNFSPEEMTEMLSVRAIGDTLAAKGVAA